jgi:4-hydroxy-tetrahydrodipicolinate synthase
MCDAALDQDRVTCLSIHEELRALSELMFCESNPIPVKWALHKMGMMSDEIRLPMTHLSTEYHQKLHQAMVKLHLI